VLKAAGLVNERREANRVMYSLVAERLAICVGSFLSAVSGEGAPGRHEGKKKTKVPDRVKAPDKTSAPDKAAAKSAEKSSGKDKHRRGEPKPAPAKPAPAKPAHDEPAQDEPTSAKPAPGPAGATAGQLSATV
jgi:hypothetical protein